MIHYIHKKKEKVKDFPKNNIILCVKQEKSSVYAQNRKPTHSNSKKVNNQSTKKVNNQSTKVLIPELFSGIIFKIGLLRTKNRSGTVGSFV